MAVRPGRLSRFPGESDQNFAARQQQERDRAAAIEAGGGSVTPSLVQRPQLGVDDFAGANQGAGMPDIADLTVQGLACGE